MREEHVICDNPDCRLGCKHTHEEKCGHDLCCSCIVSIKGARFCLICLKKAYLDEEKLEDIIVEVNI